MWYFYVLQSQKKLDWFYKGSTSDLKRRFTQHNDGDVTSTQFYRPLKLVYYEAFVNEKTARLRESCVKKSGSVWIPLLKRIKKSLK
jgi:putative endonuclease